MLCIGTDDERLMRMEEEEEEKKKWIGRYYRGEMVAQGHVYGKKAPAAVDLSGMSLVSLPNTSLSLAGITKLDLCNNNLQSIPESLTARLLNVVVMDVHSNQLRSLPNSIGCLSKLRFLNVSGNMIFSLPKAILDCRALEELNANFNLLTKLPETIGFELSNLQKLSVNSNKLASLPSSTSHMTSLRVLDARLNCLQSLPDGLENLIHLQVLNISQNFHHLNSLPFSIGVLLSLVDLDVSYNHISALPYSIGCLTNLRKLRSEGNPLTCPPMDVVRQGVGAVRQYLSVRMIETNETAAPAKRSWIGKLVRCTTFGGAGARGLIRDEDNKDRHHLMTSDYRSIDSIASPRYAGTFSPGRLVFSPSRSSRHGSAD